MTMTRRSFLAAALSALAAVAIPQRETTIVHAAAEAKPLLPPSPRFALVYNSAVERYVHDIRYVPDREPVAFRCRETDCVEEEQFDIYGLRHLAVHATQRQLDETRGGGVLNCQWMMWEPRRGVDTIALARGWFDAMHGRA
jgi:hypothetical protein